jgi:Pentapeptide repeats (8 copies)
MSAFVWHDPAHDPRQAVGGVIVRVPSWARWVAVVALGAALVLWLILFAPRLLVPAASEADLRDVPDTAKWQARDSRLKLQNDVRTTLLQGLGGLAVLVGAFYTYRQVQTGRRQLHVAQQGQVTERFSRAIDQLGDENLDVRLGGIYALERIARDSPDDQATIGEILTAYIRSHAPWPPTLPGQYVATAPIDDVPELRVRAPDIQASLTVLGRGGFAVGRVLEEDQVDLHEVDLRHAHLRNANLEGANLSGANLAGATLLAVDLTMAFLLDANLAKAEIIGSILTNAELGYANLEKAVLDGSIILSANLDRTNLWGARLERADLEGAGLAEAVADGHTTWPHGFDWVMAGVKLNGELADRFKWRSRGNLRPKADH